MSKPRVPVATEQEAREALGIPEKAPDFREVIVDKKGFTRAVNSYITIIDQIKDLESQKRALSDIIGSELATADAKTVMFENRRVTLASGKNTTLSKEKLLELGVPATKIMAATVTREYTYVTVSKEKVNEQ
jgi:hypothetical protein